VLLSGVQGITDLITTPGLINLDFADVKSVMSGAGSALMGIGSARGDDRSVAAAEMAISSPLLEASIDGAHGVLLSIQGGSDLGLFEINEAAQLVANSAAPDANIIFGAVIDDALGDEVRVTVIAAGFDEPDSNRARPTIRGGIYSPGGAGGAGSSWSPFPASGQRDGAGEAAASVQSPGAARPGQLAGSDGGNGAAGQISSGPAREQAFTASQHNGTAADDPGPLDGVPPPRAGDQAAPKGKPGAAARQALGRLTDSASTRRKSVVFEEDDELDVPDFLK
jgi:cell division protein FtsZ